MGTKQLSPNEWEGLGIFSVMANALMYPLTERAAHPRRETRAAQAPAKAPQHRRSLFDRIEHWFWVRQQRDVEAYLAKATDLYDLEARIRAMERNDVPYPYY